MEKTAKPGQFARACVGEQIDSDGGRMERVWDRMDVNGSPTVRFQNAPEGELKPALDCDRMDVNG